MIESYLTAALPSSMSHDIGFLLTRHRGHKCAAEVLAIEGDATLLLYVLDRRVVASLRYYEHKDSRGAYIYINLVHTLEEFRGRGYSTKLFAQLPNCRANLEVEQDNVSAIALYKRLGFVVTGVDGLHGDVQMSRGSPESLKKLKRDRYNSSGEQSKQEAMSSSSLMNAKRTPPPPPRPVIVHVDDGAEIIRLELAKMCAREDALIDMLAEKQNGSLMWLEDHMDSYADELLDIRECIEQLECMAAMSFAERSLLIEDFFQ